MREADDTKKGLSVGVIAGLIVAVGLAAAAGMYVTQILSDNAPVNVVVLKSDTTNFKVKPAPQEESKDAGSQSSVMNMLDDLKSNKEEIEILSLKPDAPEMPEVPLEEAQQEKAQQEDAAQEDAAQEDASQDVAEAPKEEPSQAPKAEEDVTPKKRPIKPLVIENPVANGPSMMVQLAAFRNQKKAEEVAALLTEKHKERLQGLTLGIMQADTGSSGVFWRVTTEPLPTEDARTLCSNMKRAGQDCIFRKVAVQ